jgi:hypothetical protein
MPSLYIFESALVVDTNIYADGDSLCTLLTVTGAVRRAGYYSRLVSFEVIDKADQGAAMDFYLFDRSVTLPANNAVWNVSDADALFLLGRVQIASGDWTDQGGYRSAIPSMAGKEIVIKPNSGTSIYLGGVSRGTPTFGAAGDLYVKLGFERD